MTAAGSRTWQPLATAPDVRVLTYSFGPGTANSVAIGLASGSCLVISPPTKASEETYAQIADLGPVRWLVAPNGYHYLGQAEWRARFPEAVSLAPRGAHARLSDKCSVPFVSLEEESDDLAPFRSFVPNA